MRKTAAIRTRVEPGLQNQDHLLDLAFTNAVTAETFRETDRGKNLVHCDNLEDLFERLKI